MNNTSVVIHGRSRAHPTAHGSPILRYYARDLYSQGKLPLARQSAPLGVSARGISFRERCFWNREGNTYGKAVRVSRTIKRIFLAALCLATPGTNWLLPVIPRLIKNDTIWRYE
jgi:hypothetical protein